MSEATPHTHGDRSRSASGETADVRPFRVNVPEAELAELRRRINATRWPERETVTDQSQGVQLATMQKLARYWGTAYPAAHGGEASDAFHVVVPSMPGYGYSGKPTAPGWC